MMVSSLMLFAGSALIIVWGVAHVAIPTKSIMDGFGPITLENKHILLMEWLMEGVLLVFVGILVVVVRVFAPADEIAPAIVYRISAVVLVIMATISTVTGARTSIVPMKLCPFVFVATAILYWAATII